MKRQKRCLFRMIIFIVLCSAAGFALYQQFAMNDDRGKSTELHQPAPNFTLPRVNGGEIELKHFKGKAVVVNFWGSWCEPCKREMPAIQKAYERYKGDDFEIIGVNVQESDVAVRSFLDRYGLTLPVAMDKRAEVFRSWELLNLPTTFFIHSDGTVERAYEGEMSTRQLNQWIVELLQDKS